MNWYAQPTYSHRVRYTSPITARQITTLKLVGVSTLIVVPRIRTSEYLYLLSAAIPSLSAASPNSISVAELPELRNILVVDNCASAEEFEKERERAGLRCAVDFREMVVRDEGGHEQKELVRAKQGLHCHEVMNLQFTRCVLRAICPPCTAHA